MEVGQEKEMEMSKVIHLKTEEFEREVLQAEQPVLVDFYAVWCAPCQMIAPMIEKTAADFAGRVKVAKVDVDQEFALAERFRITGIPTLILFKEGRVWDRIVGLPTPSLLRNKLEELAPVAPLISL